MAAYIDILRLFAKPELTEYRMARKSHTKEIKNKHSSRPVGGVETGTGVERAPLLWQDRDWWSVGQMAQAV